MHPLTRSDTFMRAAWKLERRKKGAHNRNLIDMDCQVVLDESESLPDFP